MRFSAEQTFFYSRVATLITGVGAITAAAAGSQGVPFWHVPLAFCAWLALGCLNFPHKTSLWMLVHRRVPFLAFYGALAGSFFLVDTLALRLELWFYPFYAGWWFVLVYGLLYPAAALAGLELFLLVARRLYGVPVLKESVNTAVHTAISRGEGALFLLMMFLIASGAAGYRVLIGVLFIVLIAWMAASGVALGSHFARTAQLAVLIFTAAAAVFAIGSPGYAPFERLYSEASVLTAPLLSIPIWIWVGSLWFVFFTFRLWVHLVQHARR